ncbi:TetR/AcrR family transcriptional regulator [Bradyrhizobium genosp. P]|uniref:TetR/AcrR family transcriptional regulator n=1 Tax=Bradyrhizobium genosp. P TaxID=83641 RepID=UPI003CF907FD
MPNGSRFSGQCMFSFCSSTAERPQGLRERKRQETSERIIEKGLKLFVKNGYEAPTLDAIAQAAGISRRTFFYYFKSKEDVLLAAHDSGFREALGPAMLDEPPDQAPLEAVQKCLIKLASHYETKESVVFDRLMQSTEALRARKEVVFVETEQILLEAMCELWPAPARRASAGRDGGDGDAAAGPRKVETERRGAPVGLLHPSGVHAPGKTVLIAARRIMPTLAAEKIVKTETTAPNRPAPSENSCLIPD